MWCTYNFSIESRKEVNFVFMEGATSDASTIENSYCKNRIEPTNAYLIISSDSMVKTDR
jgi:hypothetical protein